MSTRSPIRFLPLLLVALLIAPAALAQSVSEGSITGTVTTSTGESIRGVPVKIASAALVTGERSTVSDESGRFVFLSLPPGTYTLTASLDGFRPFQTKNIVLSSGDKSDIKVKLQQGTYSEELTIVASAPVVDTKTATVQTTFTTELLDKIPTARNAFYDLAITAPGMASVGSEESWLASPSAYGSAANENLFLVNGVNATNPRGAPWGSLVSVNYNTVEEVNVISLGSKAEYGSFSGAAIDVLTKSGSNDFKGDLAFFSQLGNASDNYTLDYGDDLFYADPNDVLTTVPQGSTEMSLTFGGPVLRDRIWFYGGVAKNSAETDTPLFEPLATYDAQLFDIKFTADFNAKHRAWAAYHREDLENGNNTWGQTWDPTMAYDQETMNDTYQLQYQWVVSDRLLVSGKYLGFQTNQEPTVVSDIDHPGYINWWKWIGTQSIGLEGAFPYVEAQKSKRNTIQVDASSYATDFLGQHELKYGAQYTTSNGDWQGGYFHGYANFAYPYPYNYGPAANWWWNGPADWQWGTDEDPVFPMYNNKVYRNPWLTVRKADNAGLFVDDTWTLNPRLTFNLGLRYDRSTASYGEGKVFEMPQTPDDINNPVLLRTREGKDDVFDFKNWSPRLGLAYVLTQDQKTVLRAHYGRYYAPMGVESLRRFGPDMEPTLVETWMYHLKMSEVDLNHNGMVDFDEVRPATRLLNGRAPTVLFNSNVTDPSWELEVEDGTTSPYTDQFEISLQRQIGADWAVEGTFIRKQTQDFLTLAAYDSGTGDYYNWVSKPYTTWTGYQTKVWEIENRDYTGDGKYDIEDAKYVVNHIKYRTRNLKEFDGKEVKRDFTGLQFVLTKRYSNRWQALAAINWNQSDGMAPRTVDQSWYIDGPMIMDTPFGSSYNHFQNNLEGPMLMTPELMLKLSGSYTIPRIETNFGMRYRYDSGRPFFPLETIPTFQSWMSQLNQGVYLGTSGNDQMVADDPNDPDWAPPTSIVDLSLSKQLFIGTYGLNLSLDVLNAFNENSPNRVGFRQGDYGRVYSLVQPRVYRAGVKFLF